MFSRRKEQPPLGLYLHIPFCAAKCAYCDFYSLPRSEEKMDAYVAALCRHLEEVSPQADRHRVDTVYLGGGTPSYLGTGRLTRLLQTVKKTLPSRPRRRDHPGGQPGQRRGLAGPPQAAPDRLQPDLPGRPVLRRRHFAADRPHPHLGAGEKRGGGHPPGGV